MRAARALGVACALACALAFDLSASAAFAQLPAAPKPPPGPLPTPKAAAYLDLTGYWVSVVTEEWAYRMLTPPKGDAGSLPVNEQARKVAAGWDPAADIAAGEACRRFGAAGAIRQPGRLHVTWRDEQTLRIDFSAGNQTRLLSFIDGGPMDAPAAPARFAAPTTPAAPAGVPTWTGQSTAQWRRVRNWQQFSRPTEAPVGGTLKVVTTGMRAGYLQSNGFPYSSDARMTEYFDRVSHDGTEWLIVTTVVEDPHYLTDALYWSTQFKREPDGAKWHPKPCEAP
jgi:hypothetical protein